MTALRRFALALGLLVVGAAEASAPRVLIFQRLVPAGPESDPNVPIAQRLAEELDLEGRVVPIVWSRTDPVFREALEAGRVVGDVDRPTDDDLRATVERLGAEFLIVVAGVKEGGEVVGEFRMTSRGTTREILRDERKFRVEGGVGADWESATDTLARTWAMRLATGPFARLEPRPKRTLEAPRDGSREALRPPALPDVDDARVAEAEELVRTGRFGDAILVLREAVDSRPLDPRRREALVRVYLAAGLVEQAAVEARGAAALVPDRVDLRLLAARCWLAADRLEDAQADLNEAMARDPDSASTSLLHGEILLARGRADEALGAFERSAAREDGFDARLGRLMAQAMRGELEVVREELPRLPAVEPSRQLEAYRRLVSVARAEAERLAMRLREVAQAGRLNPGSADVRAIAGRVARTAGAWSLLVGRFGAPDVHRESHELRALAHSLLAQAAGLVLDSLNEGDESLGEEASVTLGEAVKQWAAADRQYDRERAAAR